MESAETNYAICLLKPDLDSGVKGVVRFTQPEGGKTRVQAEITGLKPGTHGFHVHQWGDISDSASGKATGGHYNPTGAEEHSLPNVEAHGDHHHATTGGHAGDLGNLESDADGNATSDAWVCDQLGWPSP